VVFLSKSVLILWFCEFTSNYHGRPMQSGGRVRLQQRRMFAGMRQHVRQLLLHVSFRLSAGTNALHLPRYVHLPAQLGLLYQLSRFSRSLLSLFCYFNPLQFIRSRVTRQEALVFVFRAFIMCVDYMFRGNIHTSAEMFSTATPQLLYKSSVCGLPPLREPVMVD